MSGCIGLLPAENVLEQFKGTVTFFNRCFSLNRGNSKFPGAQLYSQKPSWKELIEKEKEQKSGRSAARGTPPLPDRGVGHPGL